MTTMTSYRVALAGNPNSGKTTIFNALTGTRQHVGNYPGVTVERKSGVCRLDGLNIELVDLPGIYSLSASSIEEKIVFQELLSTRLDLIVNVIDAGNVQRNLYLTTQLAELGIPMLLTFNMADDARRNGLQFNLPMLEKYFGAPIVETVGSREEGIDELKAAIAKALRQLAAPPTPMRYDQETDDAIQDITAAISQLPPPPGQPIPPRYFAIKLLENDPEVSALPTFAEVLPLAASWRDRLALRHGLNSNTLMADCRYGMIAGACREAISYSHEHRQQLSDALDKVLTNRFLGLPIFLLIMLAVFTFTFTCGEPFVKLIDFFFTRLAAGLGALWPDSTLPLLKALVLEGVIGGVGGVLMFLPNILLLFLAIAFLEGTGYMSRAAFVMDGFMHKFGLHGKSFIPMLLGFGCTVPAVMATRTIESERDRITTILILPLMSCSARLTIYLLFIPTFFVERWQPIVLWIVYLLGAAIALGGAVLLKSTLFKGDDEVFVMELPPYRLPTLKSLLIHTGERAIMYLHKAGTIILAASIILFFINTFPRPQTYTVDYEAEAADIVASNLPWDETKEALCTLNSQRRAEELEYSIAGRIGKKINLVMRHAGFDWKASSALVGAFAAKELFVSQLAILNTVSDSDCDDANEMLRDRLRASYTPLQAFSIILFCLISMPCVATVAVVKREANSWRLAIAQLAALTAMAFVVSFLVYQGGLLLGFSGGV
ncbi:MAG: Ferrous iron transport protein B [Lentisphaerae bacterium ADurb.Bin082]|nr:MAG: Ferrous iron transport protein B [Lentisphaerae bacterium ADurb.Bin082]HQL88668.1 ferrous iron transport protein B [Lentisphaeria bacterium]